MFIEKLHRHLNNHFSLLNPEVNLAFLPLTDKYIEILPDNGIKFSSVKKQ